MKSAITVSLVPEAIHGPFVFHGDVDEACRAAQRLGFDGLELFASGPDAVPVPMLRQLLDDRGLSLAAVGTGAGWLQQKLSLTSPDATIRRKTIDFVVSMVDYGAAFGAPAIIGSMQGRCEGRPHADATNLLAESMHAIAERTRHAIILYEPLNRYETDLFNQLEPAAEWINKHGLKNVRLLADLFHMNIEEVDIAESLRACATKIGHIHLADSNRGPAGSGHTRFAPIGAVLKAIDYRGFVSAEAFPKPDATRAAEMTIAAFRQHFTAADR